MASPVRTLEHFQHRRSGRRASGSILVELECDELGPRAGAASPSTPGAGAAISSIWAPSCTPATARGSTCVWSTRPTLRGRRGRDWCSWADASAPARPGVACQPVSSDGQRAPAARTGAETLVVKTFPRWSAGLTFDRHAHDDHQLTWATRGVLTVHTDEATWVLPPTRALWTRAGVRTRNRPRGRHHADRLPAPRPLPA